MVPGLFNLGYGTDGGWGGVGSNLIVDLLAVAGQSNAMGFATNNQAWTGTAGSRVRNFGKNYLLQDPAADPIDEQTPVVDAVMDNGTTPSGHWLLPTLTTLMGNVRRSFDVIPCGRDATAIAAWAPGADHQDRTTLYGAMVYRCLQYVASSGRPMKAVLWWQGESDVIAQTPKATYKAALQVLGDAVFADLACPLVACKLMLGVYAPDVQSTIDDAIGECWGTHHILAGPDLSATNTDDSYHARTDAKILVVAGLWAAALQAALYP